MNKKNKLITGITILIILIGGIVSYDINNNAVKSFSINEYKRFIEEFKTDIVIGEILNKTDAIRNAEKIWIEIYGESIKEKRPYKVLFDSKNDIWLVKGTLPVNMFGGVPYILIQKSDGKVLAVWHDK